MAKDYSINLMWINKNIEPDEEFVFPQKHKANDPDLDKMIIEWAEKNPSTPINVWFDAEFATEKQQENSRTKLDKFNNDLGRMSTNLISLKNVRDLSVVQKEANVFSEKLPVYFRADLLRIVTALDWVTRCVQECFFVYADFNVEPMSEVELFDSDTQNKLEKFGTVFQQKDDNDTKIENSFFIIGNNNENLIKAIETAIVKVNIMRAKAITNNSYNARKPTIPEAVYNSLRSAFQYFYFLEGYGELLVKINDEYLNYDEQRDGLRPFQYSAEPGFKGKFKSTNPLIMIESTSEWSKELEMIYPTKVVSKPDIKGRY